MNHKEIILPNDNTIYDKLVDSIIKKASELSIKSEIINRRELVDYLNTTHEIKIKEGIYIKNLVKDAYLKTSYSESIQKALVNNILENDGKNEVYNPIRVEDNIFCLDLESPKLDFKNISLISKQSENVIKIDGVKLVNGVIQEIDALKREDTISVTGNSKVESYKEHAFKIKSGYEELINTHEFVKDLNLNLISDFEVTRNRLKLLREDLLNLLIDLFGESIKAEEPQMFDFSEVNWEDFEDTYPKLELFFDKINNEIELFKDFHAIQMNNISRAGKEGVNNFLNNTKKISNGRKNGALTQKDVKGAAASAAFGFLVDTGISVLKSRSKSKKVIAQIELDIIKLKDGMQSDVERILNDILRLGKLHTEIKDKLIPQLDLFINKVSEIIVNNISPLYKLTIKNDQIRSLRDENMKLMIEQRQIKEELIDKAKLIEYSNHVQSKLSLLIDRQKFECNYLKSLYPEKPSGFYKVISPSNSMKLYKQTLEDWTAHCKPFIDNYNALIEKLNEEIKLNKENQDDLENLKKREKEIADYLKVNSRKIASIFKNSTDSKIMLTNLLKEIKEVTTSSKGVLEVNIAKELMEA